MLFRAKKKSYNILEISKYFGVWRVYNMKKILFAASEAVPFIKTGGLADVTGSLPKYFDRKKYDVRIILPKYLCMDERFSGQLHFKCHFYVNLSWRKQYAGIFEAKQDGKDYQKYDKNPVMTGEMLPEGCNRVDFRDPKIWKENDTYYMIVGNKNENQIGQVVLCSSKNLTDWKFETILASNESGKIGTMWECPDFFQLGSKRVLICSPQDMKAQKYEFHNGHNSVYFLGDYDEKTHTFVKELTHALDYGMDFYAPQTTELPDGRRIMIAWMKSWDACVIPNSQVWQGMMTLPRELELKDGKIWQTPVREIEKYHKNPCRYDHAEINQETTLCGIEGRTIDLTVLLEEDEFQTFSMKLAANKEYETSFTYHKAENMLEIDRTYCGVTKDVVCVRKLKISNPEGLKKMRFILDRQSIELFLNDGEQVATTAICTPLEAQEIHFYSDKKIHINVEKYDIMSASEKNAFMHSANDEIIE